MDLANIVTELWRRRRWILVGVLVAGLAATASVYRLPSFEKKSIDVGAATTQVLIDSSRSSLGDINRKFEPLAQRASVYASFMQSGPVKDIVAREAGIPADRLVTQQPKADATSEERANEIVAEEDTHRLFFDTADDEVPIVSISAQAPTADRAAALANGAVKGLATYITRLQERQRVPGHRKVVVTQLGTAQGGMVNEGAGSMFAVMVFCAILLFWTLSILIGSNVIRGFKESQAVGQGQVHRDTGSGGGDFDLAADPR